MRDHTKLRVFEMADQLALNVYKSSQRFPRDELYGLKSQMRRAAVSVASNIVEGAARSGEADFLRFVEIAYGSARELQYQVSLVARLGYLSEDQGNQLNTECLALTKGLNTLLRSLRN